jgi:hypothetical protein
VNTTTPTITVGEYVKKNAQNTTVAANTTTGFQGSSTPLRTNITTKATIAVSIFAFESIIGTLSTLTP